MIKKLLTFFAVLAMCFSCYDDSKIWDTLTDHEIRISALEKLCKEMNANISSLQGMVQSLQQNEYITKVIAVVENGKEVGYSFTFSSGKTVTVYHGKDGKDGAAGADGVAGTDGKDGAAGKDGYTPIIGVAQENGVYYWTIDGDWLLDDKGHKIPTTGSDGADGSSGSDGSNGVNGVTPQLKIVDGNWYVSYDNGVNWDYVGQATGDQGSPGVGGDSMFANIDFGSSPDYVILYLNNGVLLKIPTWLAFETLLQQCEKMNTNIAALQTMVAALESNDYVTGVTPLYEGVVEIGYKINFSKSGSVTIYHGKDGKDGADGKDGQDGANGINGTNGTDGKDGVTPVIGVAQENGVYYWTVNGSWLLDASGNKVPTTGNDGAPGQDGANGSNGANGTNGTDGKDGITPQLKIENGKWFVSYDNGASWTELGQATGDQGPQGEIGATGPQGPQGSPGVGGDSMFSDVDYSNSEYVIFSLGNGIQLKLPTWSAFETLKQQVAQANANIVALQTIVNALESNDYVTGVTTLYEGVNEIGYKISFSKSGSVTIYHGKDGKDGADGKDGQDGANGINGTNGTDGKDGVTPVIGVAQENGVYYWTVNGSWLLDASGNKVPTTGNDGAPGQDGANGSNGANGTNGTDGKDGITPQLKIENGKWFVSYDNGASWTELGQATGDQGPQGEIGATGPQGPQGSPGVGGDSMFSDVDYSNSEYVTFTLGNGTEIKVPTWFAFEALQQECQLMNLNIMSLQTVVNALENNDYVTGVTSIYEGGVEIGYRINFSKSGSIVIYHGKDGADGYVPVISASPVNGYYYWTLDGNWMLDSNGSMIPATGPTGSTPQFMIQDGDWYVSYDGGMNWDYVGQATGDQGQQGNAGASGNTPQFMIQNGDWYVSYDNGMNWNYVGQATGDPGGPGDPGSEGITPQFMIQNGDWYVSYDNGMNWNYVGQATGDPGASGSQGDSMFSFIDYYSSSDYVTFYLSDGSVIQLPTLSAFQNLQAQCNQNNQNISSLQSIVEALQCKDYIESINPIYDDNWNHVGYEMYFSQSGWVTIYHGQNGAQGHSPTIGVDLYDGRYYWTIDGSWLYDDYGNMIPTTGLDGASGENGITPQLKIENGYWYVSYDNAVTWKKLDKATGADGNDGDAFFKSVTHNDKYVTMILANGTEIKIPKFEEAAATISLKTVSGNAAIFEGTVNRTTPDLKVTVYYSTYNNLTVYKHVGSISLTEFPTSDITIRLNGLVAKTQYYFFTEVTSNGAKTYSEIGSFVTGETDSYIDWENGENIEGEI